MANILPRSASFRARRGKRPARHWSGGGGRAGICCSARPGPAPAAPPAAAAASTASAAQSLQSAGRCGGGATRAGREDRGPGGAPVHLASLALARDSLMRVAASQTPDWVQPLLLPTAVLLTALAPAPAAAAGPRWPSWCGPPGGRGTAPVSCCSTGAAGGSWPGASSG